MLKKLVRPWMLVLVCVTAVAAVSCTTDSTPNAPDSALVRRDRDLACRSCVDVQFSRGDQVRPRLVVGSRRNTLLSSTAQVGSSVDAAASPRGSHRTIRAARP